MGSIIGNFFNKVIFNMINAIGNIIDALMSMMRMFLGLDPLPNQGSGSNLVTDVLWTETVIRVFFSVVMIAMIIVFVFAIVRLMKARLDPKEDGTANAKAVKGLLASIVNMLLIPAFVLSLIFATTGVAQAIDLATNEGTNPPNYGTEVIFSTVDESMLTTEGRYWFRGEDSSNQVYEIEYDRNGLPQVGEQITGMNAVKRVWSGAEYYNADGQIVSGPFAEMSGYDAMCELVDSDKYFDNWLLPLLGGCVMLVTLAMASIIVGQRLFYCVFLFIISPLPVSVRPMDDGVRWKKWAEIYLSKLLGAFAIIIAMNVFFLISGYLTSLTFFERTFPNAIAKIMIYISGMIAATGASALVAQFIGSDAGQQERDSAMNNFRALMGGAHVAGVGTRTALWAGKKGAGFFSGRKTTPFDAARSLNGASGGGGNVVTNAVGGAGSMAGTIGKVLMGKESIKETGKAAGGKLANTGVARFAKGAGLLAAGTVSALPIAAVKATKALKAKKAMKALSSSQPNSKRQQRRLIRQQQAYMNASPAKRARLLEQATKRAERLNSRQTRKNGKK